MMMCMAKSIKSALDWFKYIVVTFNICIDAHLSITLEMITKRNRIRNCFCSKKKKMKKKATRKRSVGVSEVTKCYC